MIVVSHALHCVDGCFFVLYSSSFPRPTPATEKNVFFFFFSDLDSLSKITYSLTRELKIRICCTVCAKKFIKIFQNVGGITSATLCR